MIRASRIPSKGFTLIEVMVAMAVIALGIGALLTTLNTSAGMVTQLRDKDFAKWIALNKITEARLANPATGLGTTTGEIEYAGSKWLWRQEVVEQPTDGILRIDVSVAHASEKASQAIDSAEKFPAAAKAFGFIGTDVSPANGLDPTWTQAAPRTAGTGGAGVSLP